MAGRLDVDSTGLLILTNDGDLQHRIISPKHTCTKRYIVQVPEILSPQQHQQLEQ